MKAQRRTARSALLDAFAELALSRRYHEVGVGLIVEKAGVARSTFYYYFNAKDELLLHNLKPMMSALARLPVSTEPGPEIDYWVAHIWDHRLRTRRMFDGPIGRKIANALAGELQKELRTLAVDAVADRVTPLLAEQIAGSMLSLLRAWVAGRATASAAEISRMLWWGARAHADPAAHATATCTVVQDQARVSDPYT